MTLWDAIAERDATGPEAILLQVRYNGNRIKYLIFRNAAEHQHWLAFNSDWSLNEVSTIAR